MLAAHQMVPQPGLPLRPLFVSKAVQVPRRRRKLSFVCETEEIFAPLVALHSRPIKYSSLEASTRAAYRGSTRRMPTTPPQSSPR